MVKYINKSPLFGEGQHLPEDNILELVEFSLPKDWKKELIIQGFDSETQGLTELFKFYERLETAEEIFQTQGEGNHQEKIKQSSERHQSAKSAQRKGSNQDAKPSEEGANKKNPKIKTHLCDLCMALVKI